MTRSTKLFLLLLGLTGALGVSLFAAAWATSPRMRSAGAVLEIRLEGAWPEHDPNAALAALFGQPTVTLRQLVDAIDAAAADSRVSGLFLRVGFLDVGWGKAREIRDALLRFRQSGKPVHAWLESGHDGSYFIASAADEVRMIATGTLWLDGIAAEVPFLAGTLAKAGVRADIEQVGEYKNAADSLTRTSMTPAHREALDTLLDGLHGELVGRIGESLDISEEEARELVSNGPYSAMQALDAGLLDALAYEDEAQSALEDVLGLPGARRIALPDWIEMSDRGGGGDTVALVHCEGDIVPGRSSDGLFGGTSVGSDTIAEAVREAWEDDGASAIVLRVNSPGGSPVASDIIWRALRRAQDAGVPVVVSMSDVAASGGYWISMGADRIVADPGTITGSIGIYGGKYVTGGLDEIIDLERERLQRGENAAINSTMHPFTDPQREWIRHELLSIYRIFLEKTAEGRKFDSPEDVDRIARGRVWTGAQAQEIGLVDELGGLREALAAAAEIADLEGPLAVQEYPRTPGLFEALFSGGAGAMAHGAVRAAVADEARQALPAAAADLLAAQGMLRRLEGGGVLAWCPLRVRAR